MSEIQYQGIRYQLPPGSDLLSALLEQDLRIPNSCRQGLCHACKMIADEGAIPSESQSGLTDAECIQNQFLSCQCYPISDMSVRLPDDAGKRLTAKILSKTLANGLISLKIEKVIDYLPGQFLTLWKDDINGRCYSIASCSDDAFLEFHIKHVSDGEFSDWLAHDEIATIDVSNLAGDCCYQTASDRDMVLIGLGTGMAPLWGILREALMKGHKGRIIVYNAARESKNLYLYDQLKDISGIECNFSVREHNSERQVDVIDIDEMIDAILEQAAEMDFYICGSENMVKRLRRKIFMAGAMLSNIHSDAFIAAI